MGENKKLALDIAKGKGINSKGSNTNGLILKFLRYIPKPIRMHITLIRNRLKNPLDALGRVPVTKSHRFMAGPSAIRFGLHRKCSSMATGIWIKAITRITKISFWRNLSSKLEYRIM